MASTPTMQYVRLGKSGLKVSRIILGCMSYGTPEWQPWVLDEKAGLEHIKAAYEAGINTFDTADVYSHGHSELILGKAIKQMGVPRESVVILTKVFFPTLGPNDLSVQLDSDTNTLRLVNRNGLSRKHIFDSVKSSLERLQTDYIDVLQCHRSDPETPIEETMQALHDVVRAGWVRYIGMSSCQAWEFHVMQNYALNNGLTPFISMQNHHSLLYREEEREMNPLCKYLGVGTIPWSPLARGKLTRPNTSEATHRSKNDFFIGNMVKGVEEASAEIINRVEELAKKKNVSMAQISIAWLLQQDPVAAPIVGTTSLENLHDIIGSLQVTLTPEEIKHLGELYVPRAVVGH